MSQYSERELSCGQTLCWIQKKTTLKTDFWNQNIPLNHYLQSFLALIFFSEATQAWSTVGLVEMVWYNGNAIETCKPTSVEVEVCIIIFTTVSALYFQIWGSEDNLHWDYDLPVLVTGQRDFFNGYTVQCHINGNSLNAGTVYKLIPACPICITAYTFLW